jgi:hypothetical protein
LIRGQALFTSRVLMSLCRCRKTAPPLRDVNNVVKFAGTKPLEASISRAAWPSRCVSVKLGSPTHSRFCDLPEPLGTMARCIHLLAGTRNSPTAIDGLHPRHDPSENFGHGEITQVARSDDRSTKSADRRVATEALGPMGTIWKKKIMKKKEKREKTLDTHRPSHGRHCKVSYRCFKAEEYSLPD